MVRFDGKDQDRLRTDRLDIQLIGHQLSTLYVIEDIEILAE